MKRLFIYCSLILAYTNLNAQDAERRDAKFSYIQLPARALTPPVKTYKVTLTSDAESNNNERREQYQKELAAADAEYQQALDTYNKKSVGQKILDKTLLEQGKPIKRAVPMPTYEKVFPLNAFGETYIQLEGFTKATDNALDIEIEVMPVEISPVKFVTESYMNSQQKKYKCEGVVKQPLMVIIKTPSGETIMSEIFSSSNNSYTYTTDAFNTESEARNYYDKNKSTIEGSWSEKALVENLKKLNNQLNNDFAFRKIKYETDVWVAEGKKFDYTDMNKAFETIMMAYNQLDDNTDKTALKEKAMEAIKAWETIYAEADLKDKKARINREIAGAILLNIAEAYMWIDEFSKAEETLTKLQTLDMKGYEKRQSNALSKKLEDLSARFNGYYKK
jgi:hypothetical protein